MLNKQEEKVIDFKALYETNIFMKNVKEVEAVCKQYDVDVLSGMSIWSHKNNVGLNPKEYSRQVKEFREACIYVGYDFGKIYEALGI